ASADDAGSAPRGPSEPDRRPPPSGPPREPQSAACVPIARLHFSIRAPRPIVLDVMDGYFDDESAIRQIGRESVLMLGCARALLLQAAHPLVAAGIVDHSHYRDDPWRRLARTMAALYTIVVG